MDDKKHEHEKELFRKSSSSRRTLRGHFRKKLEEQFWDFDEIDSCKEVIDERKEGRRTNQKEMIEEIDEREEVCCTNSKEMNDGCEAASRSNRRETISRIYNPASKCQVISETRVYSPRRKLQRHEDIYPPTRTASAKKLTSYECRLQQARIWKVARRQKYPMKSSCSRSSMSQANTIDNDKSIASDKTLSRFLERKKQKHLSQLRKCTSTVSTVPTTNCSSKASSRSFIQRSMIMLPVCVLITTTDFMTEIELHASYEAKIGRKIETVEKVSKNNSEGKDMLLEAEDSVKYETVPICISKSTVSISSTKSSLSTKSIKSSTSTLSRSRWSTRLKIISLANFLERKNASPSNDDASHCTVGTETSEKAALAREAAITALAASINSRAIPPKGWKNQVKNNVEPERNIICTEGIPITKESYEKKNCANNEQTQNSRKDKLENSQSLMKVRSNVSLTPIFTIG